MDVHELSRSLIIYTKQVQYVRSKQKEYFQARKRHDETTARKLLPLVFELEKKLDARTEELMQKISQGFQSELFT